MQTRIKNILIVLSIFILFTVIVVLISLLQSGSKSSLLISCTNHLIQLNLMFNKNNGVIQLPYDKDLPGYAVIAQLNHGKPGPWINCNHGASDCWYGGWQYLNIPRDSLYRLNAEWMKIYPNKGMPIIWCGKGSSLDRASLNLDIFRNGEKVDIHLSPSSTSYKEIEYFNKCMMQIGEKEVSFDIPDNIDWSKYLNTSKQPLE